MTKTQRQFATLAGLVAVLAAVVVIRPGDSGSSAPGRAAAPVAGADTARVPKTSIPVSGVKLDLLKADAGTLAPAARNPFRFQPRLAAVPASRRAPAPAPVVAPPPVPTGPPPPPPIPLKFIGLLEGSARVGKWAVLSDARGGVFYGREGDLIEGRYQVLKINDQTAELAYVGGRGRQTIRLSGQ